MELIDILKQYFVPRQEVVAVYLFGSRAEGVSRRDSDTDLAVLLDESIKDTFEYRLELADELEHLVGMPVDLVLLREAPLLLQFQIFKKGKVVFERDVDRRATYEMYVLSKYYDYQKFFDFHSRSLRETIKLKKYSDVKLDDYLLDEDMQAIVERRLQLAIQVCTPQHYSFKPGGADQGDDSFQEHPCS